MSSKTLLVLGIGLLLGFGLTLSVGADDTGLERPEFSPPPWTAQVTSASTPL